MTKVSSENRVASGPGKRVASGPDNPRSCSFCSKTEGEVSELIAGAPAVFICDECVESCVDIIREARS
jgi:hypothetical protein